MKKIFILPVLLVLLCTFFVAAARGSIANSRVTSSILVDFIATPDSVTVDTLAVDSTKLVANADSLAVDSLAMDSTVLVAKSDSMAIDSLAVDFVAMDTMAVDSVAIDTVALANMVPDSLAIGSLAIDSLAMDSLAMDSLAMDSLAVDTLALVNALPDSLAIDSLAMDSLAMDSLAVDSVAMDTLAVDSVAIDSVAVDSVAVDSAALANMVPDSLLIGYMPKVKEWKYFAVNERPKKEQDMLVALYKKKLDGVTPHYEIYDEWKFAFNSMQDRSLDMYLDGMSAIVSKIHFDTLHSRYDRVIEYRDELMELYDLAVQNIGYLNSQIDRERSKDSLSVAKLRATQVYTYLELTVKYLKHTSDSATSDTYWREYILNERTTGEYATFMYPRYREMLTCNDPNIDMIHLYYFIGLAKNKITLDKLVGLPQKRRADNFRADKELVLARADEIYNAPDLDFYATHKKTGNTILEAYNSYYEQIPIVASQAEGLFLDQNDYEGQEKHYAELFQKEGNNPEFRRELLNSSLRRHYPSDIYIECLRIEYEVTPSYELAKQIGERYLRKYLADKKDDDKGNKQDLNNAIVYYNRARNDFSEVFGNLPDNDKLNFYNGLLICYIECYGVSKQINARIKLVAEAGKISANHPDVLYHAALNLHGSYQYGVSNNIITGIDAKIAPCAVYDEYAICANRIKELQNNPDTDIEYSTKLESVEKQLVSLRNYFPAENDNDVFMGVIKEGQKRIINFPGIGKRETVVRVKK